MSMPNITDRINWAWTRQGKQPSKTEIAKRCGVSQPSASDWFSGKSTNIKPENLSKLAEVLNVPTDWLARSDSPLTGEALLAAARENVVSAREGSETIAIEYLNVEASCGAGSTIYEREDDSAQHYKGLLRKEAGWFKRYGVKPADVFAVYAKGDSNAEFIIDGDLVIFDRTKIAPESGKLFLIAHPDGLKIKLLERTALGAWMLVSKNPNYKPEKIDESEIDRIAILGRFVYRQGA